MLINEITYAIFVTMVIIIIIINIIKNRKHLT